MTDVLARVEAIAGGTLRLRPRVITHDLFARADAIRRALVRVGTRVIVEHADEIFAADVVAIDGEVIVATTARPLVVAAGDEVTVRPTKLGGPR